MKGTNETITDAIFIIGTLLFMIIFIEVIAPQMLDLFNLAVVNSSDFVSKEMAELVTVSGASPYQIQISYNPSGAKYNLNIQNRILQTQILDSNGAVQKTSVAAIANNAMGSFADVNMFYITEKTGGITIAAK